MLHVWAYPARFEPQDDGEIVVRFPDLPEVLTSGADEAEARANAEDALEELVLDYLHRGAGLPAPSRAGKAAPHLIPVPTGAAASAILVDAFAAAKISKREFAARLAKDEKQVRRLFTGEASTDQVLAALRALGARVALTTEV